MRPKEIMKIRAASEVSAFSSQRCLSETGTRNRTRGYPPTLVTPKEASSTTSPKRSTELLCQRRFLSCFLS